MYIKIWEYLITVSAQVKFTYLGTRHVKDVQILVFPTLVRSAVHACGLNL
jgi:hypothetical protein